LRFTSVVRERSRGGRDYTVDLGAIDAEGVFSWSVASITDARNLTTVYERGFAAVRRWRQL